MKIDGWFDWIWSTSVHDATDSVLESIPPDVRERYRMDASAVDAYRWQVYGKYRVYNKRMHEDYFKGALIDVHKILACFVAAMVDFDLIRYDRDVREKDGTVHVCVSRAKYEVAMRSGLRFLYLFMQFAFDRCGESALKGALIRQGTLAFPKTMYEHGDWLSNRISALLMNHVLGNRLDTLAYADMMFWIELYNKEHLEWSLGRG